MARELSQEALLDFLCQAGGRVTNAALLSHFKGFLRDPTATPGLRDRRRELFKGFVNSVAAVRQDSDGTKCVVLRRRYRDLLGEGTGQGAASGPQRRGARPDPTTARDQPGTLSPEISRLQRQHPAPHVQDRPELVTPGTSHPKPRSPESPHLQRQHPAPPTPETPGTTSPETLHLQSQHPAPPVRNRPEPVTSRTLRQSPETLHLQRHHPFPSVRDRPEPLTLGTSRAETPHLQWDRSAPRARDRSELEIQSYLYPEIAHPHLQRTREWVARHHQMPEPAGQNPVRAWSVLPDDFLQLHSKPGLSVRETAQAESSLFSQGFLPGVPTQSSESWLEKPSPKVFRSIRCQLSLKDMEDFVDQESHSSEESSSEPTESPAGSGEGLQAARGAQDSGEPENPTWVLSAFPKKTTASQTPQDLRRGNHPCTKASGGAEEPLPLPPPRPRRSFRRSPQAGRAAQSSSDEECLDEDSLKRTRRPPRPRKPSKAGPVPSPRVNATLTPKPAGTKAVVAVPGRSHSWWDPTGEGFAALVPHRPFEHKSSLVPLEPREHKWIVKLARGSWIQVLALFWEDPQLALHRDFLTGYTALHWIAKHGSLDALQDLVSGAQKAGIVLDVNVRSSCGYTPLHLAAMHGHQGIIKLLVQRLASRVNVRDSSGKKPWQYLASNTSGEIWQLLGAPPGKPIFPVQPIVSPTRKTKRHITRKTSLAALLKSQHNKWKLANHHEKFPTPREQEEYTD